MSKHSLVLLYLLYPSALISQSLRRIVSTQLLYQSCCVARYISGEFDGIDAFQYDVVSAHRIWAGERRCA